MRTPIEQLASLTVGTVEAVSPDRITAVLELDAPQATAFNAGTPTPFPRINGYVLIPNEGGAVVGLVVWLGIERSPFPKRMGLRDFGLVDLPFPLRKMHVTPVATLSVRYRGPERDLRLERGVSVFPSVGDPVLLPTEEQLRAIVEARGEDRRVRIGVAPLAASASVSVDPDKLFGRHLAILGNTGSGKSCTVAGLIRWSLETVRKERRAAEREPRANARFVVLDPNGEYARAFADLDATRVFRVPPVQEGVRPFRVPAWLWNSHEWGAFAEASTATQRPMLLTALRNLRAGRRLEGPVTTRLGLWAKTWQAMIEGIIADGPRAYTEFGPRQDVGRYLGVIK